MILSLQVLKLLLQVMKTEKSNEKILQINIVFLQNELLAKNQIIKSLLERQTTIL